MFSIWSILLLGACFYLHCLLIPINPVEYKFASLVPVHDAYCKKNDKHYLCMCNIYNLFYGKQ